MHEIQDGAIQTKQQTTYLMHVKCMDAHLSGGIL